MSQYGSNALRIDFDNSSASPINMSNYIREFNGMSIEALLQESHAFGDTWFESTWTGIKKLDDIVLGGYYDDTATTGPEAIFNALGATRTF